MKPIYPDREYHKLPSLTVGELFYELLKQNPNMVVAATWEGTLNAITPDSFKVEDGMLLIDVENH